MSLLANSVFDSRAFLRHIVKGVATHPGVSHEIYLENNSEGREAVCVNGRSVVYGTPAEGFLVFCFMIKRLGYGSEILDVARGYVGPKYQRLTMQDLSTIERLTERVDAEVSDAGNLLSEDWQDAVRRTERRSRQFGGLRKRHKNRGANHRREAVSYSEVDKRLSDALSGIS